MHPNMGLLHQVLGSQDVGAISHYHVLDVHCMMNSTRKSSRDEIPECDIAPFCCLSCT